MDIPNAKKVLLALAETVGTRLRNDQVQIEVVAVGIRYSDLSYVSHQKRLRSGTNLTLEIYEAACDLFMELWNGCPVRHLGIHTARVQEDDFIRQMLAVFILIRENLHDENAFFIHIAIADGVTLAN